MSEQQLPLILSIPTPPYDKRGLLKQVAAAAALLWESDIQGS